MKLLDASGRIQKEWRQVREGQPFELENADPGLYFIQVLDGGIVRNFKLFLE